MKPILKSPTSCIIAAVLIALCSAEVTLAQQRTFTGTVVVHSTQFDQQGNQTQSRQLPLSISPQRIRINGINRLDPTPITSNLGARDMLIRLDSEDFVFIVDDTQGISIKKQELQSLITMMGGNRNQPANTPEPEIDIRSTSEQATINGYSARKWIVQERGTSVQNHVWVSDEFSINWGMLTESWVSGLPGIGLLPIDDLLTGGRTPLKVETYRENRLISVVEMKDVKTQVNRAVFEIPSEMKLITLQELMLNRMRNY